jgi:dTDP-4-amino-4,6-dideoxygalactose transaminase
VTPVIPLAEPDLSGNEARYLQECVTTGFVSSVGPFVGRFEEMVARAAGAREAVATASGTVGLHLALVAAGVKPGDLVIIPSFTFIATANAVAHCGASPWIFDISPESWTIDPALVARTLAAETRRENGACVHRASGRRVAALMPVHTLGLAADMDALDACAREYDLKTIADAACALGASYKGRAVGGLADLSVISFNGNKTVTSGGGGAVVGDDAALVGLARHLGATARRGPGYDHDQVGFNYRMTNLQAAVGCAQLERLADLVAAKRRIRATYDRAFARHRDTASFPGGSGNDNACWLSGIVTATPDMAENMRRRLTAAGIEAKPFWKPIHLQAPYRDAPATAQPVGESLWQRVVTLPSSTSLDEGALARVIAAVEGAWT